ncbi:pectinesterase inhibitor 9-like [Punica granatum]|uniref:Pectinesterase inhibitor domain-containing protein n=2 Tax=Punica granatum TaxID=22663 RepID=A0A218WHY9_PUNGR|nr:pectinesterase inhibitor 9-like [Punica granatum]OWM71841.1 hypothetical protein CDL15_Pgr017724 [Punica granatum]PKI59517.1 hypothetical protein CRG98_020045 [Punica granatum]
MAISQYALFTLFLFLVLLSEHLAGAEPTAAAVTARHHPIPTPTDVNFIKSTCMATRYPALCVRSLSGYAAAIRRNDRHLAQAALLVSLSRARSSDSFFSRLARSRGLGPWDHRAVRDCVENLRDTVDQLAQSMRELGRAGREAGQDFEWHMSNVQTWVSAALTDEDTCMDGFSGHAYGNKRLKAVVRRRVVGVAQVTSNALALVNRFASKHRVMGEP